MNQTQYEKYKEYFKTHNKNYYEKMKQENPEKIKEWRNNAYEKMKETNPEKLAQDRREASRRYYEKNKEKCIKRTMEWIKKKKEIEGLPIRPRGRPRKVVLGDNLGDLEII